MVLSYPARNFRRSLLGCYIYCFELDNKDLIFSASFAQSVCMRDLVTKRQAWSSISCSQPLIRPQPPDLSASRPESACQPLLSHEERFLWCPSLWRGGKGWIQKKTREPFEFRQIFQLKIEKSDLYLKMTALVKLLLLVVVFFVDSDKVSEFRQSVRQVLSWIQKIALPTLYS